MLFLAGKKDKFLVNDRMSQAVLYLALFKVSLQWKENPP
jgi:hypothetical protein